MGKSNNFTKLGIIATISVMAIALLVSAFFLTQNQKTGPNQPNTPQVTPGPITVEGTVVCLPHKNTEGPQTAECAFGMQSTAGAYYGLKSLNQEQIIDGTLTVNTQVKVSGDLLLPEENERYGVVGNIEVKSIEVITSAANAQNVNIYPSTIKFRSIYGFI